MKFIRPITIDAGNFTSTNILEAPAATYNGGTSYSIGDQVSVYTGTTATMYESLANGNLGNTPSSSPLVWKPIGIAYKVHAGDSYSIGDRVYSIVTHRVYESLVNANLGTSLSDPTKWLDVGPTNKWAMFDAINGTMTTHPSEIDVSFSPSGRVDAIGVVSMENVVSVQVIISTVGEGEIFNQTYSASSVEEINDWHDYFFEEVVHKEAMLITGIPIVSEPDIQVIFTGSGTADMSVGTLLLGRLKYIGATLRNGASVGITDYSRKEADDFGNYVLVERAFAKRGSFRLSMPHSMVDDVHRVLSDYRATPTIYSAADDFSSTMIFGFYKDFSIDFAYPTTSYATLEIEGLT
jgi:hypothetical protein